MLDTKLENKFGNSAVHLKHAAIFTQIHYSKYCNYDYLGEVLDGISKTATLAS